MTRGNAEGVNISTLVVDTQPVGAEGVNVAANGFGEIGWHALLYAQVFDPLLHEFVQASQNFHPVVQFALRFKNSVRFERFLQGLGAFNVGGLGRGQRYGGRHAQVLLLLRLRVHPGLTLLPLDPTVEEKC